MRQRLGCPAGGAEEYQLQPIKDIATRIKMNDYDMKCANYRVHLIA